MTNLKQNEQGGSEMDNTYINKYNTWLRLEKGLSANTIEAYTDDLHKLFQFIENEGLNLLEIRYADLQQFVAQLSDIGISPRSQARIISGIKSFYRFLLLEDYLCTDPTELLESPKIGMKLPEVLSVEEVNRILTLIDLSLPAGQRNRAMLEVLYSCGLRVSELIRLKYSDIYFDEEFIRVEGKGKKQRLVPISQPAIHEIKNYLYSCGLRVSELIRLKYSDIYIDEEFIRVEGKGKKQRLVPISQTAIHEIKNYLYTRRQITAQKGFEDILFLNRRGTMLSRVMVFYVIKQHAELAGIDKTISPHTFRHSFATHLLEGGANLRAIQLMLGHEKITTTELYTHIDRSYLRKEILEHHPRNK